MPLGVSGIPELVGETYEYNIIHFYLFWDHFTLPNNLVLTGESEVNKSSELESDSSISPKNTYIDYH